jgi:hypothetical protein
LLNIPKDGKIQLNKDKEAVKEYFLEYVNPNTMFFHSAEDVNPIVMNGILTSTSNQDFFSSVGNGYLLTPVEDMKDEDYNFQL